MAQDPNKPKDDGKIRLPPVDNAMNKLPPKKKTGGKGSKDDGKSWEGDEKDQDLLLLARKRFDRCISAEGDNRKAALEDIKFIKGDQWPADVAAQRNMDKRPCLTFNKLKTFAHQITNPQRENRPAINISPVGDGTDIKAGKMYGGLFRYIQRQCRADIAYDTAFWNAVVNGFGYIRVTTEYEAPDSFNQNIVIQRIRNPFTVYMDPDCQDPAAADAKFAFITETLSREEYKEQYPDSQMISWNPSGPGDTFKEWVTKDSIRVAEYYYLDHKMQRLVQLDNGHTGWYDELAQDIKDQIAKGTIQILKDEDREKKTCYWKKINALEVLDETEVKTDGLIPIARVIGDEVDEQGKVTFSGIVRDAKDPQRMYNYWRTTEAEIVALQPKAPFVMEEGQLEGHEDEWRNANTASTAVLTYKATNIGGKQAPPPSRQPAAQAPQGVLQAIQGAAQDMQAVTGIRFDATIAERVHDESGKAMRELRRSGDIGSYHYEDNLARALHVVGQIVLNMIPNYIDTKRVLTILREDGKEQPVMVDPNAGKAMAMGKTADGKPLPIFNPTIGKYAVTVTVGPSYATKRIEASEQIMEFMKAVPQQGQFISDLLAKNQDWPDADIIYQRLHALLPPQIQMLGMGDIDPQVQNVIQSMQRQIQQMTIERQQMVKQLQDQTADRMIMQDKNEKDFEAKVLGIMQKAIAAQGKQDTSFVDQTLKTIDMMHGHTMDVTNQGMQADQFSMNREDKLNQPKP